MANFYADAGYQVDMTAIDFYRTTAGATSAQTLDGTQTIIDRSYVYGPGLAIKWAEGTDQYATIFNGDGITVSADGTTITGGVLTSLGELNNQRYQYGIPPAIAAQLGVTAPDDYWVTGVSVAAADVYKAFLTPDTADDHAILMAALSGDDTISGSALDDILFGGGGNDKISGGGGFNTVVYRGSAAQYTVTLQSSNTYQGYVSTVSDSVAGRDGTDSLSGVSQLQFTDYTVVFVQNTAEGKLVYELYQAAYGRTPDNAGFRYWAGFAGNNNLSAAYLAQTFLAAPEFTQLYGSNPTNNTYVTGLYTHVLGRSPDAGGLSYWVGLENAGMTRDQLLVAFATSNENVALIGAHTANGYWTTP